MVDFLLKNDLDINARNAKGLSPIMIANLIANESMVSQLQSAGAKEYESDQDDSEDDETDRNELTSEAIAQSTNTYALALTTRSIPQKPVGIDEKGRNALM